MAVPQAVIFQFVLNFLYSILLLLGFFLFGVRKYPEQWWFQAHTSNKSRNTSSTAVQPILRRPLPDPSSR
ncbi:Uncharacterized protein HZ326_0939 [Fusarium oxysporum f. sp. albedinis]|nr:Uncharacterized protein HZ326_0939 [Fusarium oxysporum f. sp. albedinis]